MSAAWQELGVRLEETDARLAREVGPLHTLNPARERPTPLAELAVRLLNPGDAAPLVVAAGDALERLVLAQLRHFPKNLLWDFDYMGAVLVKGAREHGLEHLKHHVGQFAELQRTFGCESTIRFRYVHDFVYGFDWERHVRRDPAAHAATGPFDVPFLERLLLRGGELRDAIARGEDGFGPVSAGQWRNPFAFSRVPEHEIPLHRGLARDGLIAVQAWRVDARPDYSRPYTELRLERAKALNLVGDSVGPPA